MRFEPAAHHVDRVNSSFVTFARRTARGARSEKGALGRWYEGDFAASRASPTRIGAENSPSWDEATGRALAEHEAMNVVTRHTQYASDPVNAVSTPR